MTAEAVVRTYLRAKDENRPHLMQLAFAETAKLEMEVETGTISFPPLSEGIESITKVLVRDFGQVYENVYTFCLTNPPPITSDKVFECRWVLGMSEKTSGAARVGCGRYHWSFQTGERRLVAERLGITIKIMQVLPPDYLNPIMQWLSELPYPWCPPQQCLKGMPEFAELQGVRSFIEQ
jgi:hypothetical protein